MEKRFIRVGIYKCGGQDFSNGGLSSHYNYCYLEHEHGNYKESEINPDAMIKLEKGAFGSINAKPIKPVEKGCVGYMMGGCYIASCDSRFSELVEKMGGSYGAIALHDRTETYEVYDLMSR